VGRWDPFGLTDLDDLRSQMFKEIDQFDRKGGREGGVSAWNPRSSITETKEGEYLISAEMPGMAKEDVSVDLKDGMLSIKAVKKEESKDEKGGFSRQRRSFFRSFALPDGVDASAIKAKMENGILELTIPKPKEEEQKASSIAIQ